jgi:hypothetical protein
MRQGHVHGEILVEVHVVLRQWLRVEGFKVQILHLRCAWFWHQQMVRSLNQALHVHRPQCEMCDADGGVVDGQWTNLQGNHNSFIPSQRPPWDLECSVHSLTISVVLTGMCAAQYILLHNCVHGQLPNTAARTCALRAHFSAMMENCTVVPLENQQKNNVGWHTD